LFIWTVIQAFTVIVNELTEWTPLSGPANSSNEGMVRLIKLLLYEFDATHHFDCITAYIIQVYDRSYFPLAHIKCQNNL